MPNPNDPNGPVWAWLNAQQTALVQRAAQLTGMSPAEFVSDALNSALAQAEDRGRRQTSFARIPELGPYGALLDSYDWFVDAAERSARRRKFGQPD